MKQKRFLSTSMIFSLSSFLFIIGFSLYGSHRMVDKLQKTTTTITEQQNQQQQQSLQQQQQQNLQQQNQQQQVDDDSLNNYKIQNQHLQPQQQELQQEETIITNNTALKSSFESSSLSLSSSSTTVLLNSNIFYCPVSILPPPSSSISSNNDDDNKTQQQYQKSFHIHIIDPELPFSNPIYHIFYSNYSKKTKNNDHDNDDENDDLEFPITKFTSHVQSIVNRINVQEEQLEQDCKWNFYFTILPSTTTTTTATTTLSVSSSSRIHLFCTGKKLQRIVPWWCKIWEQLFQINGRQIPIRTTTTTNKTTSSLTTYIPFQPILPTNITIAISSNDRDHYYNNDENDNDNSLQSIQNNNNNNNNHDDKASHSLSCLASSSPNGTFAITNFLELQRMADRTEYPIVPWEERCPIPIWRGSAWMASSWNTKHNKHNKNNKVNKKKQNAIPNVSMEYFRQEEMDMTLNSTDSSSSSLEMLQSILSHSPRLYAVWFSKRYPMLLDAKISDPYNGFMDTSNKKSIQSKLWKQNATNGLNLLLPIFHEIPSISYYTQYQTVVIFCGLGASFRTSIHLSTATTVLLQDCPLAKEWFVDYHNDNTNNTNDNDNDDDDRRVFIPWKHYIPLSSDLKDLKERLEWIKNHPNHVYDIAQAGYQFYHDYLSFERNYEHLYELIYRVAMKKKKKKKKKLLEEEKDRTHLASND